MLSIYGVHIIVNVVITILIQVDLISWGNIYWGIVMITTTQPMDVLYCDRCIGDVFFLFTIEVFRCLHQQSNNFFINVLTWHGQPRVLKAFLCWYCIQFISKGCQLFYKKIKLFLSSSNPLMLERPFLAWCFFKIPTYLLV